MRLVHLTSFVAVTASTTTLDGADDCQKVFDVFVGGDEGSHCKEDGNCDQLRVRDNGAIQYGGTAGKPLTCDDASELIGHKSPPAAAAAHSLSDFGAVGIHNIGNTCYMNSAIQILGHLLPFAQYFIELQKRMHSQFGRNPPSHHEQNVMNGFIQILRNMYSAEHVLDEGKLGSFQQSLLALRPEGIMDVFEEGEQADAPEALQAIVQILSGISGKYPPMDGKLLDDLFKLTQVETTQCAASGKIILETEEPRIILNGVFTEGLRQSGAPVKLVDTLNAGLMRETVQIDSCLEGDIPALTRDATKLRSIRGFGPEILVIGLQRIDDGLARIDDLVRIPSELVLERDLAGHAAPGFTGRYRLVGIIEHGGTAKKGHYIAKYLNYDRKWYESNDWRVTELRSPPEESRTAVLFVYTKSHV